LLIGRYTLDELKNEQEWGEFIDRSAAPEVLGMKIRIDMENDFSVCVGCRMAENMMNSAHKSSNKEYRAGYDAVKWDKKRKPSADGRKP